MKSALIALLLLLPLLSACSVMPFARRNFAETRIFVSDYSTAWSATLEALAQGKDVIKVQNREQGLIETNWIDNTDSQHFMEEFTDEDFFLRSRYKLQVQLREGKKNNDHPVVLVRLMKFTQMERTFLGGWEDVESNSVVEKTYLYRIGRLIAIQQNNAKQEELRRQESEDTDLEI